MKKEDFLKLGLDEDTAKKCADASAEELKTYIPKTRFDEVNNDKKRLELDVRDRDGQLETLKNSTGDVEGLKKQIKTLQAENKAKDEKHAAEIRNIQRQTADNELLTNAKARNNKAVLGLLDSLDDTLGIEEYKTKRADQIKKLQEAEDSKFLFDTQVKKTKIKGAEPGDAGKEDPDSKVDTSKMSYEELCAYLEESPGAELE